MDTEEPHSPPAIHSYIIDRAAWGAVIAVGLFLYGLVAIPDSKGWPGTVSKFIEGLPGWFVVLVLVVVFAVVSIVRTQRRMHDFYLETLKAKKLFEATDEGRIAMVLEVRNLSKTASRTTAGDVFREILPAYAWQLSQDTLGRMLKQDVGLEDANAEEVASNFVRLCMTMKVIEETEEVIDVITYYPGEEDIIHPYRLTSLGKKVVAILCATEDATLKGRSV